MRRYLVFSGVGPAGEGGWLDFVRSFDTETDAVAYAHANFSDDGYWWEVVDLREERIIRSSY